MLAIQIHDILLDIAKTSYPDCNIPQFWIDIIPEERRSVHGNYRPSERRIKIYNLSRKTEFIVATTIHELAHHMECTLYGSSGHSKRFYTIYKILLETAVKMGLIKYDEVREVSDARDIRSLERLYGKIEVSYDSELDKKKDLKIIRIHNSYFIKNQLSGRGYKYNGIEQVWYKVIATDSVSLEEEFLLSTTTKENIEIVSANNLTIEAVYYCIVKGGYDQREVLKKNNYRFRGYNFTENVWVKKIKATVKDEEEKFLISNNITTYKFQGVGRQKNKRFSK